MFKESIFNLTLVSDDGTKFDSKDYAVFWAIASGRIQTKHIH